MLIRAAAQAYRQALISASLPSLTPLLHLLCERVPALTDPCCLQCERLAVAVLSFTSSRVLEGFALAVLSGICMSCVPIMRL